MEIPRRKAVVLFNALRVWKEESLISNKLEQELEHSIKIIPFDWKRLARYSFITSIICLFIAASTLFMDKWIQEFLLSIFTAPFFVKSIILGFIAGILFSIGSIMKKRVPHMIFRNESVFFLGILAIAGSIFYLGQSLESQSMHFSLLVLFSSIIYGGLAIFLQSKLIWIFALLSMGGWMGAETAYISGGAYFLGMNYPMRFVFFGGILWALAACMKKYRLIPNFYNVTRVVGLLYFFIALWILSIFGNLDSFSAWTSTQLIDLFYWALLFALATIAAIYYALKSDDPVLFGFGITFLFINLYTRFFEYFWNMTHKTIFFSILGLSLWYLGSHAEKIWNFRYKK